MKNIAMWLRLIVTVVGLGCVAVPATMLAAEDEDDRDRQTQIQRPMPRQNVCPPGMCVGALPPRRPGCPIGGCVLRCLLIWVAIVNVLLASWVFSDIRKRGEGHGIFVVLALLAGLPATILYALVRIGDAKKT